MQFSTLVIEPYASHLVLPVSRSLLSLQIKALLHHFCAMTCLGMTHSSVQLQHSSHKAFSSANHLTHSTQCHGLFDCSTVLGTDRKATAWHLREFLVVL